MDVAVIRDVAWLSVDVQITNYFISCLRTRRAEQNLYVITRKTYSHDMQLDRKYRSRIRQLSRKLHKAHQHQKRGLRRQIRVTLRKLTRLPL